MKKDRVGTTVAHTPLIEGEKKMLVRMASGTIEEKTKREQRKVPSTDCHF